MLEKANRIKLIANGSIEVMETVTTDKYTIGYLGLYKPHELKSVHIMVLDIGNKELYQDVCNFDF